MCHEYPDVSLTASLIVSLVLLASPAIMAEGRQVGIRNYHCVVALIEHLLSDFSILYLQDNLSKVPGVPNQVRRQGGILPITTTNDFCQDV